MREKGADEGFTKKKMKGKCLKGGEGEKEINTSYFH